MIIISHPMLCKDCHTRFVTYMLVRLAQFASLRLCTVSCSNFLVSCRCDNSAVVDANIVCKRAKLHYLPGGDEGNPDESESQLSSGDVEEQMEKFFTRFKPVHTRTRYLMYFT